MTILTDISLTKLAFTWDPNNPNYSTNGMFDPSKKKPGAGSCRLDLTLASVEVNLPQFSRSSEGDEALESTHIIGAGEPEEEP